MKYENIYSEEMNPNDWIPGARPSPTPDDKLREVGVYASQFANFAQRVKMKFWDVTTTSTISDELLNEILLLAFADFTKLLTAERTRMEEEIKKWGVIIK